MQGASSCRSDTFDITSAISSSVLATALTEGAPEGGYQKEWNVNGEKALLTVVKN